MNMNSRFKRTPVGEKTPRMKEVEKRLGRTLEEDYREMYLNGPFGQKRLATRWGVKKGQIFDHSMRGGRRCWVQMLQLPVKRRKTAPASKRRPACELCGTDDVPLERAHWVAAKDGGGSKRDNILMLCPNCHTKLDHVGDANTVEAARGVILLRVAKEAANNEGTTAQQFLQLCRNVINGRAG